MEKIVIEGKRPLSGEVKISGSKNSALPIMAATLLTDGPCVLENVPRLRDTLTMAKILKSLGKAVDFSGNTLKISSKNGLNPVADYDLVSTMRGSFCVLGPLLAKLGHAKVSLPGGCVIGVRPVDLHLKGLRALGAKIEIEGGYIVTHTKGLKGAQIYLGGVFGSSVLATDNIMMAAVLAKGETIIESAACEPEVEDLGNFLNSMGAKITGHGTPKITIKGVKELHGANYSITSDRIEAATFVLLAAATKSPITVTNANYSQLLVLVDKLEEYGAKLRVKDGGIDIKTPRKGKTVSVTTYPYPG
ncbi:MAG TPA: UDP-N-acetylglucosamine 1-carboxyvinyltransferase, partial [Candidatus Omnitrophota bacterium]|nr:UDP-N-acetylglucosamine 1-carboxyvinyltransferase [Candidatus Omnitrophota bacterium]